MWHKGVIRKRYDRRLASIQRSQTELLNFASEPYEDSGQFMALTDENVEELTSLSARLRDQAQDRIDQLINEIQDDTGFHDAAGILLNVESVLEEIESAFLKVLREYEMGNVAVCALQLEQLWV